MHFTSTIVKPPFEARSINLQVTSGCSHNNCKFCRYYNDVPFSISPISEIKEDILELKNKGYSFKRIWLQGANPFVLSSDKLEEIGELVNTHLPFVESIGCYSRVDDLNNKTVDDLIKLKKLGYDSIVFGVESGDDNLLKYMNKGYSSNQIVKQISKMDKAQITYTLTFLNKMGGHNYTTRHARKTAGVFNRLHPKRIMINQLTVHENTHLKKELNEGIFNESTPTESVNELKAFIEALEINTFLDATNETNTNPFFGRIQENKMEIINFLEKQLGGK